MSKKLNLILHCGGHEVSREDVVAATTPEKTETWCPISHISLIDRVTKGMENSGLNVVESIHGLWKDGLRYFGLMQVERANVQETNQDSGLIVGLRNSHDKSFPASLVLGNGVFVCDNLSFSGEVKLSRRHTKNIERDLPEVVSLAIARLSNLRQTQEKRIEAYKAHEMNTEQAHDFICRAVQAKVIGSQRVLPIIEQWAKPNHEEFLVNSAWSLFNGFTEIMKPRQRQGDRDNNNLHTLPASSQKLHALMDIQVGLDLDIKRDETLG